MKSSGRRRLQAVRESIGKLPHCDIESTEVSGTDLSNEIYNRNGKIPKPEALNMSTSLAVIADEKGECQTVGCIAGMAMALYPQEVRTAITEQAAARTDYTSTGKFAAIASVLGLDEYTGECLFFGLGSRRQGALSKLTPREVTAAIARAEQGVTGKRIWASGATQR